MHHRTEGSVRLCRLLWSRRLQDCFDKWPIWKILIWTSPLFIALFPRWEAVWGGWYSHAVRVDRKERLRFDAPYSLHRRAEGSVRLCRLL